MSVEGSPIEWPGSEIYSGVRGYAIETKDGGRYDRYLSPAMSIKHVPFTPELFATLAAHARAWFELSMTSARIEKSFSAQLPLMVSL
ncbi:MAG: hypothetical protein JO307_14510 [Bryobacterales bacterium]|nr:hypothetical protein [Bryobacterales bacterium]